MYLVSTSNGSNSQESVGWAIGQEGVYQCTIWHGGGVMDMHTPWPGQDSDDSDQHRARMGMGMDVGQEVQHARNHMHGRRPRQLGSHT